MRVEQIVESGNFLRIALAMMIVTHGEDGVNGKRLIIARELLEDLEPNVLRPSFVYAYDDLHNTVMVELLQGWNPVEE